MGAAIVERQSPAGFVGWRRVARSRWQPVVKSGDASECLDRLLDYARESGRSGESVVLPAGRSPTDAIAPARVTEERR